MRILGLLLLCLALPLTAATTITTQIHEVDHGEKPGDEILVFLKSGDVARLSQPDSKILDSFTDSKTTKNWLTITMDDDRQIISVEEAEAPTYTIVEEETASMLEEKFNYVPTTIASMATAKKYISTSRRDYHEESQCFNRAQIWTYEWWRKHSLRSNKILVFWSKEFVRKNSFKWWFHISPYAHIMNDDGQVVERVMDVKYISKPVDFRYWTDYHSPHDPECKVVSKYSDYANYPYGHSCYLMRTNMYTYQPADLEMNEAWGYTKSAFNMDEVRGAYLEAFKISL